MFHRGSKDAINANLEGTHVLYKHFTSIRLVLKRSCVRSTRYRKANTSRRKKGALVAARR